MAFVLRLSRSFEGVRAERGKTDAGSSIAGARVVLESELT